MRFDIERMLARAAECENQSMYIECALTGVMVDYYFDEFLKAASTSSVACDVPVKVNKKRRAVEIEGCRIFFIRFDDVITKRTFDDGGVIWDYIVEEDE